jgi:NADPH:quinone reductase-like Zn-dependent oxidoreductase
VGTLAVQIAAHSGAHVTAVVGRADRAAGLREMGAAEVVEGIESASGRYALILESGGGASLSAAVQRVEPHGTIAVYGNSAAAESTIGFGDFRGAQNARIQSFFYFTSEAEEMFAPDLALLVGMIADGHLRPVIGAERGWGDFAEVAVALRDRRIPGKAVFRVGA